MAERKSKTKPKKAPPDKLLVSVILSFRNEEDVLSELIGRLENVFKSDNTDYELIFVNDDSDDGSLDILLAARERNNRVKIINMSRRFGHYACILAGMARASGEAVINMDSDLQDPPEVIAEMLAKWREGADSVYTVRTFREGETTFRKTVTRAAYRVIHAVSDLSLPVEAGDFRLLSRRAIEEILRLGESQPYLRGLMSWVGFKQVPVYYQRAARSAGETHYPGTFSWGALENFMTGFTSFSMAPIYGVLVVGIFAFAMSALGLLAMLFGLPLPDGAGMVLYLLLLWGGLMGGVGVVGVYISRIYSDVRGRPSYIIRDTIGFPPRND
ncbi:MAG: glycosyltransferase [Rhodospirillaceae bacterium]|jgi:dolichol-phosphate mannosyltransferase|nr:glycosyltransferase [Rhodospirillaceae bacterium]|tara:strand:- start:1064 stop:2047 length:984 start_codon:yes stop_codon:yes gene_type:complete